MGQVLFHIRNVQTVDTVVDLLGEDLRNNLCISNALNRGRAMELDVRVAVVLDAVTSVRGLGHLN